MEQAGLAQPGTEGRVCGQLDKALGDRIDLFSIYVEGARPAGFRQRGIVAGEDGGAAGERFDDRKAEPFVERGVGKKFGGAVEGRQVGVGDKAGKMDMFV